MDHVVEAVVGVVLIGIGARAIHFARRLKRSTTRQVHVARAAMLLMFGLAFTIGQVQAVLGGALLLIGGLAAARGLLLALYNWRQRGGSP